MLANSDAQQTSTARDKEDIMSRHLIYALLFSLTLLAACGSTEPIAEEPDTTAGDTTTGDTTAGDTTAGDTAAGDTTTGDTTAGDTTTGDTTAGDTSVSDVPVDPCEDIGPHNTACTEPSDCRLVFHQVDCCGSQEALGINESEATQYQQLENMCVASEPTCDCIPEETVAQDGNSGPGYRIAVDCVGGQCESYVPEDPCLGIPEDFGKTCVDATDCFIALHQTNCCGTRIAVGLSVGETQPFTTAEDTCRQSYPGCGCASEPTLAEDGSTGPETELAVACNLGVCETYRQQ